MVSARGPSHRLRCSHLVNASNTSVRGASTMRVVVKLVLPGSATMSSFFDGPRFLLLQFGGVVVEALVARPPKLLIVAEPVRRLFEAPRLEPARPALGIAAARDQA